jgi:hypothetical protein
MAIQRTDKKGYKNPDSFTNHFNEKLKCGTDTRKTGFLFTGAAALFPAIIYSFLTVPSGNLLAEDQDLYTGFLNQNKNYSYFSNNRVENYDVNDGYFLMRNEVGYELYSVNRIDDRRLGFIADVNEAETAIAQVISNIEQQMSEVQRDTQGLGPFSEAETRFVECDYMSGPYEHVGNYERYQTKEVSLDCEVRSGNLSEQQEILEEELAMWQEAALAIAADENIYSVNPTDVIPAEMQSSFQAFMSSVTTVSLGLSGLLLGGVGAASAVSSRNARKKNQPRP